MGIDAEMLVRSVPTERVNDDWLTELSWRLCNSIGATHFMVSDGLRWDDYKQANDAWHAAFKAHPLYLFYKKVEDNWKERNSICELIHKDIGPVPEQRRLAIDRTLTRYREDDDPPPGTLYHQDGYDILAAPGECLLELSLYGRYYGEDYERGDILTYCAIAEWLEVNIPGCAVLYGGDSSGVCAEPFTEARRRELRHHLYSEGGRDYFNHDGMRDRHLQPPACGLCPGGRYRGSQCMFGGGGNTGGFHCRGCGKSVKTTDAGKTWEKWKDEA